MQHVLFCRKPDKAQLSDNKQHNCLENIDFFNWHGLCCAIRICNTMEADMVGLTERAVEAVKSAMDGADVAVAGLRVMAEAGGCAGYKYSLALETEGLSEDTVIDYGAVKLFVDANSFGLVNGTVIDFVEGLEGSGFVFDNPNAQKTCGCGKSFC
jgi:iron-sulfur cluster assembly protein